MEKKKYYAVVSGRKTGIFLKWFGKTGAKNQIHGFKNASYKSFSTITEAKNFILKFKNTTDVNNLSNHGENIPATKKDIQIYTDGCSLGNPGPGGYGIVIIENKKYKELSGGFNLTTNNRMELMACIVGLKYLERKKTAIFLYSDSKYVTNGICKGWANNWENNNWINSNNKKVKNIDLWKKLLFLCKNNKINFRWIKGHSDNKNNERCDYLANEAAKKDNFNKDIGYKYSKQ